MRVFALASRNPDLVHLIPTTLFTTLAARRRHSSQLLIIIVIVCVAANRPFPSLTSFPLSGTSCRNVTKKKKKIIVASVISYIAIP